MIVGFLLLVFASGIENCSSLKAGNPVYSLYTWNHCSIAAQAMTNMLEMLNGTAVIGVGIGLMTVVGQSLGAGRKTDSLL